MDQARETLSLLSVDDDREVRQVLHEIVSFLGYASVTAVDGVDALEKLRVNHFDIVITDIHMPRMDGIELVQRIKAEFEDVDVIAITVHQARYKYTDIIALGASDFISKPFDVNELEAKIRRVARERGLRAELKRLSTQDGLTGLYNRRYFDENLRREAIRAVRQHYGMYLLFIDIDKFKAYNDRYGHQQGDKLIKELARILQNGIRKEVDSAYRYGGDEFAAIIPYSNRQQALLVAERLRISYNQLDQVATSLSIGLAKLEGGLETLDEDIERLLRNADQALYLAKRNGGNQVCMAGSE